MTGLVEHLTRQFVYDDWANREALRAIRVAKGPTANGLKILAHVIGAGELWLCRLDELTTAVPVWPTFTADECGQHLDGLTQAWPRFLKGLDPSKLASSVRCYVNTKGERWTSAVLDILQHVVIHGAYHRGQIAAALRSGGDAPPQTDFIHCVRLGFA